MCAYEPLGPFVPLASHRTCWVVSRVSNGSSWLLTALFIPNEKAIRRRYGPPEQTNAWISLQQGSTLWTQSIGNGITNLHLRWRQKNDVSRKLQHGCSIAFSFPSSNDAQMLVISPFFESRQSCCGCDWCAVWCEAPLLSKQPGSVGWWEISSIRLSVKTAGRRFRHHL